MVALVAGCPFPPHARIHMHTHIHTHALHMLTDMKNAGKTFYVAQPTETHLLTQHASPGSFALICEPEALQHGRIQVRRAVFEVASLRVQIGPGRLVRALSVEHPQDRLLLVGIQGD